MHRVTETGKSSSGNPYYVILKVSKSEFRTVRVMKKTNPTFKRIHFTSNLQRAVDLRKLSTSETDTLFFNSYHRSTIDDAKTIDFKYEEIEPLKLKNIQAKGTGEYAVYGFVKWLEEEKVVKKIRKEYEKE